jgi:hypothetical protein
LQRFGAAAPRWTVPAQADSSPPIERHVARRAAKALRSLFVKQSLNGAAAPSQSAATLP